MKYLDPDGRFTYDSHDPTIIHANLDDIDDLRAAGDAIAEADRGLKIHAYGETSGISKVFENYKQINDYISMSYNDTLLNQGMNGVYEIALGAGCAALITIYCAGEEAYSIYTQKTLSFNVAQTAFTGYQLSGLLLADGAGLLVKAFSGEYSESVFFSVSKDLFFSSPYQDVGRAMQLYQEELKNDD